LPKPSPRRRSRNPSPGRPARVVEWNAYYDLYVAIGVLLLAFVASANEITYSPLWTWLQAGREMATKGSPLLTDTFSYTEKGARWVNIPWLFQWSHALVHDGVMNATPGQSGRSGRHAGEARAVRRRGAGRADRSGADVDRVDSPLHSSPGPGLWWSSVAAAPRPGGIRRPGGAFAGRNRRRSAGRTRDLGTLFLALELYIWHRAVERSRPGAAWALVPLFLLWANIAESFLIGFLVLAAGVLGLTRSGKDNPLPLTRGLTILGGLRPDLPGEPVLPQDLPPQPSSRSRIRCASPP